MKEIIKKIEQMEGDLLRCKFIELEKFSYYDSPANLGEIEKYRDTGKLQDAFLDFYTLSSGHEVKWSARQADWKKQDIIGSIKILPFQQVIKKWDGVVFFDDTPADSPLRKFYPFDFFADEAAVGICTLPDYKESVYLFKFEAELIPLYLDMAGYLELQVYAKGFWYWQYAILEIIEGESNPTSDKLKEYMPQLFPGFSWEEFKKKYDKLKTR